MDRLIGQRPLFKIIKRTFSALPAKQHEKILCRLLVDLQKTRPPIRLLPLRCRIFLLRKVDARPLGKRFHRFPERVILVLHQECKNIASRVAAKTIVHLFIGRDRKRTGLLIMERAQPEVGTALF